MVGRKTMIKPTKIANLTMLSLVLVLNGCSILGIDLTETRTIAISKPPYTIALDGDLEQKDLDQAYKILQFLSTQKLEGITNPAYTVQITDQTTIHKGASFIDKEVKIQENVDIVTNPQNVRE